MNILKITAALLSLYPAACLAQTTENHEFSRRQIVGLLAGYDQSGTYYLRSTDVYQQKTASIPNYSAYLVYNYQLYRGIYARACLGIAGRGFRTENSTFRATYIQVPLGIEYSFFDKRHVSLSTFFGGYIGYRLSFRQIQKDNTIDLKGNTKMFDLGAQAGFSIHLPINDNLHFSTTASFQSGFKDVYNIDDYSIRSNRSFSLGIGLTRTIN